MRQLVSTLKTIANSEDWPPNVTWCGRVQDFNHFIPVLEPDLILHLDHLSQRTAAVIDSTD